MSKIKIYSNSSHYLEEHRYQLNDTIKALWNERSTEERTQVYGEWVCNYEYTSRIENADVVFLTMKWNYYVDRDLLPLAEEEILNANRHDKKIVVFSAGDHPANITFPNVLLFEAGGYRSKQGLVYHSGYPFFMKDYLQIYCDGDLQKRIKPAIPTVGFCGQAGVSPILRVYRSVRNRLRKIKYQAGLLKWQPPPFETTSFRRNVLKQFEKHGRVRTNFLLREKYHAGNDQDKGDFSSQKMAFVRNVLDSDYTICVRGGGNFSIRFYETLSLGRIPVFIDTDSLLPFEDLIPYRKFFPFIKAADLPQAADILANFHQQLTDADFLNLQEMCRNLWLEHFKPNGFHTDLQLKINQILGT